MTSTRLWFRRREPNQLSPVANALINFLFLIYAAICVIPLLIILGISFSSEEAVLRYGYSIIPRVFSLQAYDYLFRDGITIARAYGVTLFTTIVGTLMCVMTVCLYAYPLSRTTFKFRKFFMYFVFVTMLFSGGMVASYVVNTNLLGLKDNIWIMILPMGFNAFWVIVMRTFFKTQIPESLIESAKIDGAGEWYTLLKIVLPLSLPGIATVALFSTIGIWNDFFLNLLYIQSNTELYNLQRLIQQALGTVQALRDIAFKIGSAGGTIDLSKLPNETFRMAMCVVTIGPIIMAYPFFQKYFIRGLTIGALKG